MQLSVRYKILTLIVLVILVSVAGYALLLRNVREMEQAYQQEASAAIEARINTDAERINTYMTVMEEVADNIATSGEALLALHDDTDAEMEPQVRQYLESVIAKYPHAIGCGFWFEPNRFFTDRQYYGPYAYWDSGKVVFTMGYSTDEYDYHNQDWYTQAIPKNWKRTKKRDARVYWSAPYVDTAGSNALMVTVSGILYDRKGVIAGMSTFDLNMEDLKTVVGGITVTPSSRAFAVETRSGLITAYPADDSLIVKPVSALPFDISSVKTLEPGSHARFATTVEGRTYTVFYSVTQTGMGLGIAVPDDELYAKARALAEANTWTLAGVVIALLLLSGVIVLILDIMIIRPILSLARYSRTVAEGNMDADIVGNFHSEYGVLRDAMGAMVTGLKEKMRESAQQTEEARQHADAAKEATRKAEEATQRAERARQEGSAHAARQLRDVVGVLSSASEELAAQIEESTRAAEAQSARIDETASAVEEMSASVLEIARNAETTASLSESSRTAADEGATQFKVVLSDVRTVETGFQSVYASVDELSRQADGIGAIAQTIEDIADQTNLLALNAAIEAARAGDAGRGFAVVADEVRKLAEKTMTATKEVGRSISAIQNAVRATLGSMDTNKGALAKSVEEVGRSEALLQRIASLALEASDQVRTIATAAEQQSAATEEINHSVEDVSHIAGESADAMRQAAAAVVELSEQANELQALIAELERE